MKAGDSATRYTLIINGEPVAVVTLAEGKMRAGAHIKRGADVRLQSETGPAHSWTYDHSISNWTWSRPKQQD
jgi:hypothetical protein